MTTVAERIQARLDATGKNPSGVALEAGLGRSSVRDILLGRVANPGVETLRQLVVPLECSLAYLVGIDNDQALEPEIDDAARISNRIGAVRKNRGLTQNDLAEKLGVHWVTISKIERGVIKLNTEWMAKISSALECQISEIIDLGAGAGNEPMAVFLDPEVRERLEAAIEAMPYKPAMSAVIERGITLAITEMETMMKGVSREVIKDDGDKVSFMARLPEALHERIKNAAKRNGRSMNAEIVHALNQLFPAE